MEITKWNKARTFWCIFYMILLQNITPTTAGQCRNLSTCSCDCEGDIIDLSDLANKEGAEPRFRNYAATYPGDKHLYSYNPCVPFTQSAPGTLQDTCHHVASCRLVNLGGLQFYDLGTQESVEFSTGSYKGDDVIIAKYTSADKARHTEVILQCQRGRTSFEAYGEDPDAPGHFLKKSLYTDWASFRNGYSRFPTGTERFVLKSPHCCISGILSVGSVLIIIFVGLVVIYVTFGVVYNAVRYKARGPELVNHVTVITAFPGLVKDGCVFVFSRCRSLPQKTYSPHEDAN